MIGSTEAHLFNEPQPLQYAPPRPWRKSPAALRLLWITVLVCAALPGAKVGSSAWHCVGLYVLQQKCLDYASMHRLRTATTTPPELQQFEALLSPPGQRLGDLIFLGRCSDRHGVEMLLALRVMNNRDQLAIVPALFRPGSLVRPAIELSVNAAGFPPMATGGAAPVVEFAKIDPENPAHLTFAAHQGEKTAQFDCWVDEADVMIEMRDDPATDLAPAAFPATSAAAPAPAAGTNPRR